MRLPAALVPLRNSIFRELWLANVIAWLGTWLQNTGAGWLMTSLAPQPFIVAMVQAATIMPVFLLALPGGALADIVDRRVFLIGAQLWTILAAIALATLTVAHAMTAFWLLALTFAIGIGSALTAPAWSAIVPELVPREDLVQAIALNGIGFNLTRAIGPALAGVLILLGGSSLAFSLYAVSIVAVLVALFTWHRGRRFTGLPREHLLSAMRAGVRFVRNTPAIQYAMVRTIAYSVPAAAPWALLPLLVREHLGLGPGHVRRDPRHDGDRRRHLGDAAAVGSRAHQPRHHGDRLYAVLLRRHRLARRDASLAARRARHAAVRRRLDLGLRHHPGGGAAGLPALGAGAGAVDLPVGAERRADRRVVRLGLARRTDRHGRHAAGRRGDRAWAWRSWCAAFPSTWPIARPTAASCGTTAGPRSAGSRAGAAAASCPRAGHGDRALSRRTAAAQAFLAAMAEVRKVRGRAGAMFWQLYEDVAHPEGWLEVWSMESWTDHLREVTRLSEDDRAALARAGVFQCGGDGPRPARYIAVDPH